MMRRTPAMFLMLCLAAALPAAAREVMVGSYAGLLAACQAAMPGDTITIGPGVYTIAGASRIMITARPGPVLVRGATGVPGDVIVQGNGQDDESVQMIFNLEDCPRWTFQDLTTRNSYYHGFKFDKASTDCVLRNIVMRDHGESGIKGTSDPAAGVYPDRLLVDRCDIGFTTERGGTRTVVEGVDGVGVNGWVIRHCRFVNIQNGGAPATAIFTKGNSSNTIIDGNRFENCFIGASFGGGGTGAQFFRDNDTTYEHRNGIISNNVIIRCTDAGIYINKGTNCRIYNNTLFECELTIQLRYAASSGYVRNNLVLQSPTNQQEPVIRRRDGATLLADEANRAALASDFVNATGAFANLDLHLVAISPAVNAGVDLAGDVGTDYDMRPRPLGGRYDIGAYEFSPALSAGPARAGGASTPGFAIVPNPITGAGTLRCVMPESGHLTMRVVDLLGRERAVIFGGYQPQGPCAIALPATSTSGNALEPGLYMACVAMSGHTASAFFTVEP